VAELGAAFLCADLGVTPEVQPDHAAYLAHWLQVLKEDKRVAGVNYPVRSAKVIVVNHAP